MDRKCRIPEEPAKSNPDSLRVLIKLSNGKRLERRFLKSHSLQVRFLTHLSKNVLGKCTISTSLIGEKKKQREEQKKESGLANLIVHDTTKARCSARKECLPKNNVV